MSGGYDYLLKFVVVGDAEVGKTCLLGRFVEDRDWSERGTTIGVDFGSKTQTIGSSLVKLHVWDTAGQESFRSITRSYYRGAAASLLVYDVTRRESFEHLREWLAEVRHSTNPAPVISVVGNKTDLQAHRRVSTEEASALAAAEGALFFETSARVDRPSVQAAFTRTAEAVLERLSEGAELSGATRSPFAATKETAVRSGSCCGSQ